MHFLAYADIHHDCYSNGLTLEDTIAVEHEITQYAASQRIKYIFFLGDWYRATNPLQRVIKAAEHSWVIRNEFAETHVLVGNHDRETKSAVSAHAFAGAGIFEQDLGRVNVYDKIQHRCIEGVDFFFVPSGHSLSGFQRPTLGSEHFVILFHGMVAGSALAGGGSASSGISPAELMALQPTLVFGGDNHTPQSLNGLGIPGYYLGAPCQHNWGDQGQMRGWWEVWVEPGKQPYVQMHVSQAPRFVRLRVEAGSDVEVLCKAAEALQQKLEGRAGIVEITVTGPKAWSVNPDAVQAQIVQMGMRRCKVIIDRQHERVEVVSGISTAGTAEDKWKLYVSRGAEIPSSLNPTMLAQMGQWALEQARTNT